MNTLQILCSQTETEQRLRLLAASLDHTLTAVQHADTQLEGAAQLNTAAAHLLKGGQNQLHHYQVNQCKQA